MLNGHLILREHMTGVHYYHQAVTEKLCENISDYYVKIACYKRDSEVRKQEKLSSNHWMTGHLCYSRIPRIFSYFFPIELFFGRNDIYVCDGLFPLCLYKSKRICIVFDMMSRIYPRNYSIMKRLYLQLFFHKLSKADRIITDSDSAKADIVRFYHVNPAVIDVCYAGPEKFVYTNLLTKPDDADIDIHAKFVFYIGDMRPNKNLMNMIRGFLKFCEDHKIADLYFYIAGKKGYNYQELVDFKDKSAYGKQVIFLGYVSDKDKALLFTNTMAVLLVSYYEGFGIPIVDGFQFHKPVITSNCSSMKEIGEGAAILVDPCSIEEISEAVGKIYFGRYAVNEDALKKKLEQYSYDRVALNVMASIRKSL
jgi:glycosyltransferase involved in cell wall biosynthesis